MSAASSKTGQDRETRRPWRDNIEAVAMAIVMAVMLKYFIVEAYQIPTGSMQPTLMGNDEAGIKDRILVDKLSYHFRDPERFEVAVFRYPLDRSKNFIKRICGMPGEQLRIWLGDLWTRKDESEAYRILRRPIPVQGEVWKRIHPGDRRFEPWKLDAQTSGWTVHGRDAIEARGDGWALLPNDGGSVMDNYRDGYPGRMADAISRARASVGVNPVGDLRIEGQARALPGCSAVVVVLREGGRSYRFVLPGPAADAGDRPRIESQGLGTEGDGFAPVAEAKEPWRLPAGGRVSFAAQNMDDLLVLEVDGDRIAGLEVPQASDQASRFEIHVAGEGADLTGLELYRDIYYTEDGRKSVFDIPEGSYVMLGDNTQDSSDSRFWTLATYRPREDGPPIRGNWFPPQNPVTVTGDPEGPVTFFRDEWGELHHFPSRSMNSPEFDWAGLVPRDMILGRAVAVFWPISLAFRVWRLQWVH